MSKTVSDELLIESEIYNKNEYDIAFFRMMEKDFYTINSGVKLGPETIVCKSKEFCILPTSYYTIKAYDKDHALDPRREIQDLRIEIVRNYGNMKRQGNKLPSLPSVQTRKYF